MSLKPFFCFYGGKWRAAPRYPAPKHTFIVEPFAGAAGYSTRHYNHNVALFDRDPVICELWDYLITASPADIRKLPAVVEHADEVKGPARHLVGFWLNKGTAAPCKTPGAWMRKGTHANSFWGEAIRARIAHQVAFIKHWTITHGSYECAPDAARTWFIDPPYQGAGALYRFGSEQIDYSALGRWCRSRVGQVMVCENDGADWLPFKPFLKIKSLEGSRGKAKSAESLYYKECE